MCHSGLLTACLQDQDHDQFPPDPAGKTFYTSAKINRKYLQLIMGSL